MGNILIYFVLHVGHVSHPLQPDIPRMPIFWEPSLRPSEIRVYYFTFSHILVYYLYYVLFFLDFDRIWLLKPLQYLVKPLMSWHCLPLDASTTRNAWPGPPGFCNQIIKTRIIHRLKLALTHVPRPSPFREKDAVKLGPLLGELHFRNFAKSIQTPLTLAFLLNQTIDVTILHYHHDCLPSPTTTSTMIPTTTITTSSTTPRPTTRTTAMTMPLTTTTPKSFLFLFKIKFY